MIGKAKKNRCFNWFAGLVVVALLSCLALACGKNLYSSAVSKSGGSAKYEQVRILLDERKYVEANSALAGITTDSNEKRILAVAVQLGKTGLILGDIVIKITEETLSKTVKSGIDNIFNLISDAVVGTGDIKTQRLSAIEQGIGQLDGAPDAKSSDIKNLGCFLAGVLTLPTIDDGLQAITDVQKSLTSIQNRVIGSGAAAAQCPGLEELSSGLAEISQIQQRFSLVLSHIQDCSFINITQTAGNLNQVEQKISAIIKNADKGCTTSPTCTGGVFCQALSLGCVKDLITVGSAAAVAGDGVISTCELLQNCLADPSKCFSL